MLALRQLKDRARLLKREVYALHLAYQDPRVAWYARAFAACVVAYAFSPVDLIPDPIPVLGYVDDLILIPLGIAIALRLIPQTVMHDCREKARVLIEQGKPGSRIAAAVIITIWLLLAALSIVLALRLIR